MSLTLVNLNLWLLSIAATPTEQALDRISVKAALSGARDCIGTISENLIEGTGGVDRDLLSKSLQETILYCTGIDPDVAYAEVKARLLSLMATRGKSAILEQFLCLCLFNFVWFRVGDSFRVGAVTINSFEQDMDEVERICQRIVISTSQSYESRLDRLKPADADELISTIEDRLRDDSQGLKPPG